MTKKIDDRKYKIIKEIIKLDDEKVLSALEKQLEQINPEAEDLWDKMVKPMRKTITLEEMIEEQNYKPISAEDFFAQAEKLEIEESIEELLAELD